MRFAKDGLASNPTLGTVPNSAVGADSPRRTLSSPRRKQPIVYRPPRTMWGVFARITRAYVLLALGMIPICGAAISLVEVGTFSGIAMIFSLLTTITLTLGFSTLGEYVDHRRSLWPEARHVDEPSMAGSTLVELGIVSAGQVLGTGLILLALGLLCSVWLTFLAGWPILCFVGVSALLIGIYMLHPTRHSFLGWGLAELGAFLAFGPLCVAGSYYAQTRTLTATPFWVGIPLGLLAMLVLFNYNLVHLRRDWIVRKRTMAVVLGHTRAVDFGIVVTVLAYGGVLLAVVLTPISLWVLAALATLPLALGAYGRIPRHHATFDERLGLYRATVAAAGATGLLFSIVLLVGNIL